MKYSKALEYFVIFNYRTRPEVPVKNAGNLRARFENMAKQNEEEAKRKAEEERKKREEKGIFYIFSCRFLNPIYFFPIWIIVVLMYYFWETCTNKLKSSFSENATKIWKNLVLTLLSENSCFAKKVQLLHSKMSHQSLSLNSLIIILLEQITVWWSSSSMILIEVNNTIISISIKACFVCFI